MADGKSIPSIPNDPNITNFANALRTSANMNTIQAGADDLFEQGQIAYQYAPAVLIFVASGGVWYQRRDILRWLDAGWDQFFGDESGYLTSQKPGYALTSMQLNGYPGRKLPFVVQSLGLNFDLPFTPTTTADANGAVGAITVATDNPKANKYGARRADCQNIAEALFRDALAESYLDYQLNQNCTRRLGLPDFMPSGSGVGDSDTLRTYGYPMPSARMVLRREPIVLPKSNSDNALEHLVRLHTVAQNATTGRGTPCDPSFATPVDNQVVAIPVRLTLQGFFGKYTDASETIVVPADDYEVAAGAAGIAKIGG
jgi:hypothetical protein